MPIKQHGIATLAVTIILVLIATIATLYANRQAFIFQKTSANYYANSKAFEAAEAGANEFAAQVQSDLNLISTGSATPTDIITIATATGATACRDNFFNAYNFIADFADTTTPSNFASDRYFSKRIQGYGAPEALGLGYRVRATMSGLNMVITSTGCADDTTATPSKTAPACVTAGQPTATVTVTLPLKGRFNPNKAGFSVKGYADSFGSITSQYPANPTGFCAIVSGESFTRSGATDGTITPYSDISALTPDQYFEMYFGSSKTTIRNNAIAAGTKFSGGSCPVVTGTPLTVWIDGDLNLSSGCNITAKNVIVNGDIIGNGNGMTVTGLLFANNLYSSAGDFQVFGAFALAGNLDAMPLGQLVNKWPMGSGTQANGKTDASNAAMYENGSKKGNTNVTYDPTKLGDPNPPGGPSSQFKAGLWHDF